MNDFWDFIKTFYFNKGVFTCRNRMSGTKSCEVVVEHLLFPPANRKDIDILQKWFQKELPSSYVKFLSISNGGLFFTQKIGFNYNSGFMLYSAGDVQEQHKEVIEWLKDYLDEDYEEDEICRRWLSGILVIGEEVESGNYIVIDFNRKKDGQDYPIIFLDHEIPFSCSVIDDDDPILAKSVDEILYKAAQNPAGFLMEELGGIASYYAENDDQWFPVEYRSLDDAS